MMKDPTPHPHTPQLKPAKRHLTAIAAALLGLVRSRRGSWAEGLVSFCSWQETYPGNSPRCWDPGFPLAIGLTMTGSDSKRGSSLAPQVSSVFIDLKNSYWVVKVSFKKLLPCSSLTVQYLDFGLSYAKNGELLKYIRKIGSFDETCTRFYTAEMVSALEYLHGRGIIHRYQAGAWGSLGQLWFT